MRIDYGMVVFEIIAIFAAYLMLFLPVSYATNINIHFGAWTETTNIDPDSEVLRSLTKSGEDGFTVSISNATSRQISRVVIYKCRDTEPDACIMAIVPETINGNAEITYEWNELADTAAPLPQTGYLVILVELEGIVSTWHGFRYRLRKTEFGFDPVYDWDISSVDVYAVANEMVNKIKDFIDDNGMIPFNPAWTSYAQIGAASAIADVSSDSPPTGFSAQVITGNTITGLSNTYSIAFPNINTEYYSPVTFYLNPSFTCGDSSCESGLGETSANCCIDCPCGGSNQYCDVLVGACLPESMITLEMVGSPQTGITNCYEAHTINVHARVNSAPGDMSIKEQYYKLGSQPEQAATCTESNDVYNCPITIPADPECGGSDFVLGPNTLTFVIGYMDGTQPKEKTISMPFPDVTVSTWTCGNGICETGLNENDGNCCYDCVCSGEGEYCDFNGDFDSVQCRQEHTNSNLHILDVEPTYFYTQQPSGSVVNFIAQITSRPAGLISAVPGCSATCIRDDSGNCESSCSASCVASGNDPDIYNSTCSLTLSIGNYNETEKYFVYPTFTYAIAYNNGSNTAGNILSKQFTTITVDSHWCGDGICNPDENPESCCFDCACPAGQYCDTQNAGIFTQGDTCRPVDPVTVSIVPPYQTEFDDSMFTHVMGVDAYVENTPSGAVLVPSCSFAGSDPDIKCSAECSDIDSDSGYSLCAITIPSIDYRNSSYFDGANNRLLLEDNALNLSIVFSNGSLMTSKLFSFGIPDLTINVTYHCGMGGCEAGLGETTENCCIDCGCPDPNEYCYTGGYLAGQCLDSEELNLVFDGTFPSPTECTITQLGGDCVFTRSQGINAIIMNQPDDLEVVASWYESGGDTKDANCMEPDRGDYTCSVVLDDVTDSTEGTQNLDAMLGFTVSYTANGTKIVKNLTAPFIVEISRVKSDYVKTCEETIADLDEQIEDLEDDMKTIETILYVLIGITVVCCVCCVWPANMVCESLCKYCEPGLCITSCVGLVLLPMMSDLDSKIEGAKMTRDSTCATDSYGGLRDHSFDSFDDGNLYMTIAFAIVCLYCMLDSLGSSPGGDQNTGSSPRFESGPSFIA